MVRDAARSGQLQRPERAGQHPEPECDSQYQQPHTDGQPIADEYPQPVKGESQADQGETQAQAVAQRRPCLRPDAAGGTAGHAARQPQAGRLPEPHRTIAPLADVKSALLSSAAKAYWGNGIVLRPELMEAVGWEESGWQSTIKACDGGTGTMQVMPDTATWMNEQCQCDTSFSITSLTGNIAIGAEYLEWLVRYFGDKYFAKNYSLKGDPDKLVLLDVVIAAYQQGFGVIDNALKNQTDLPNWWYVYAVEGFMTSQPWVAALSASPAG